MSESVMGITIQEFMELQPPKTIKREQHTNLVKLSIKMNQIRGIIVFSQININEYLVITY